MISRQITGMAGKFIAGTDAASALPGLRSLWNDGIAFSVDLLGEACVSDAEADQYRDRYLYNDVSARSGVIVFSSSQGSEYSYGKHNGIFPSSEGQVESLVTPLPTWQCGNGTTPPSYDKNNGKITFSATLNDCP